MRSLTRDQVIVAGLLALLALGGLWWAYSLVSGAYEFRAKQIQKLREEVKTLEKSERETQKAKETIERHKERSLPNDPQIARSAYQTWLLETLEKSGFGPVQLQAQSSRETSNRATRHTFALTATEEMPKMLEFLNRFYSSGLLHRIDKLALRPQKDSRKTLLTATIEALSLRDAEPGEKVSDIVSETHRAERFPKTAQTILERNFFGLPNRPPALDVPSVATVQRGRAADFNWKATDPDPFDRVTLELVDAGSAKARLDPNSGAFRWTPEANGEYVFKVRATDDSFPKRSVEKTIRIAVVDPPPPPPPEPPKPGYDIAKHAYLTAVLQSGDVGEIWINIRTTGKTLRLREGDAFEIGQSKGTVESIGERDCVIVVGSVRKLVEQGRPLAEAREMPDPPDAEPMPPSDAP